MTWYKAMLYEMMRDVNIHDRIKMNILDSFSFTSYLYNKFDNFKYENGVKIYMDIIDRNHNTSL